MQPPEGAGPLRASGSARLRVKRDFERVLRQGRRRGGQWLSLQCLPNSQERARLGIVAPKRWVRRAVDRNTAKRILREIFRRESPGLAAMDVVLRIRKPWSRELRVELANDARVLLQSCMQS